MKFCGFGLYLVNKDGQLVATEGLDELTGTVFLQIPHTRREHQIQSIDWAKIAAVSEYQ
jgi:hypothetical protein